MTSASVATRDYILEFIVPFWFLLSLWTSVLHHKASSKVLNLKQRQKCLGLLTLRASLASVMVLAGLFCEIDSLILILLLVLFVFHQRVAFLFIKFKYEENYKSETNFHLSLDDNCIGIPIVLISLVICIHWQSFFGIFHLNSITPDFSLRLKEVPIDPVVSVLILVLGLLTVAMPYVIQCLLLKRDMTRENIQDSGMKS